MRILWILSSFQAISMSLGQWPWILMTASTFWGRHSKPETSRFCERCSPITSSDSHHGSWQWQDRSKKNPLYEHWSCTDQLVHSWIFGTLSEEVPHTLLTSRDVWLCLAENFNKSPLSRYSLQLLTKKDKNLISGVLSWVQDCMWLVECH